MTNNYNTNKMQASILTSIGWFLLHLSGKKSSCVGVESFKQLVGETTIISDLVENGFHEQSFGYGIRLYIVQYLLPSIDKYLKAQLENILSMRCSPTNSCGYGIFSPQKVGEVWDITVLDSLAYSITEARSKINRTTTSWTDAENKLFDAVLQSERNATLQIADLDKSIKKYCELESNIFGEVERHMNSIIASLTALFSSYWDRQGYSVKLTPFGSFTTSLFCGENSDLDISLTLYDQEGRKIPIITGGRRRLEYARKKVEKKNMQKRKYTYREIDEDRDHQEEDEVVTLYADDVLKDIVMALQSFKNRKTDFSAGQITTSNRASVVKTFHKIFNRNIDICLNNEISVRKSKLVAKFVRFDPRARELMMAIKYWTVNRECSKAKNSMLNSYSWNMLVIYFLQRGCGANPVLPMLVELLQDGSSSDEETFMDFRGKAMTLGKLDTERNTCTTAELLLRFFLFYGSSGECERTFHVLEEIASIRKGECISSSDDSDTDEALPRMDYSSHRIEEEESVEEGHKEDVSIPYTEASHSVNTPSLDEIANSVSKLLETNPNLLTSATIWRISISDPLESDDPAKRIRSVEAQCFLLDELRRGVLLFMGWLSNTDSANNVFGVGLWDTLTKKNSNVPVFANKCLQCQQPCFHLTYKTGQGSTTPSGYMSDFALSTHRKDDELTANGINGKAHVMITNNSAQNGKPSSPERGMKSAAVKIPKAAPKTQPPPPQSSFHPSSKAVITKNSPEKKPDNAARIISQQKKNPATVHSPSSGKSGGKSEAAADDKVFILKTDSVVTKIIDAVSTNSVVLKSDQPIVHVSTIVSATEKPRIESVLSPILLSSNSTVNVLTSDSAGDAPCNASYNALSNATSYAIHTVPTNNVTPGIQKKQKIKEDACTISKSKPPSTIVETKSAIPTNMSEKSAKKTFKNANKEVSNSATQKQASPKHNIISPLKKVSAINTHTVLPSNLTEKLNPKKQVPSHRRNNTANNAIAIENTHLILGPSNPTSSTSASTATTATASNKKLKKKASKNAAKPALTEQTARLRRAAQLLFLLMLALCFFYYASTLFYT